MAKSRTSSKQTQPQASAGNQFARCVEINTYEDKKGREKEIYTMCLDDNEHQTFTMFESKSFKAHLDECFVPLVIIVPTGYLDRNGQPKSKNTPMVNWVSSDGFSPDESLENEQL